jgi:hypothetical protein
VRLHVGAQPLVRARGGIGGGHPCASIYAAQLAPITPVPTITTRVIGDERSTEGSDYADVRDRGVARSRSRLCKSRPMEPHLLSGRAAGRS